MSTKNAVPIAGIAFILLIFGGLSCEMMAVKENRAKRAIACTDKAKNDLEAQIEKLKAENQQLRQMIKEKANGYQDSRES